MSNVNSPLLQNLNPDQAKAVKTTEGRVLILAGAGSGKTLVLTTRMVYLINECNVSPTSILGLTFTNKAASEMRARMGKKLNPALAKQVTLCTFHSFCMKILREEIALLGYTGKFTLYDEHDIQRLVTLIARDILGTETQLPSLAPTIAAIQNARNRGGGPESIIGTGSEWHDNFAQEVYRRLKDSMRAYNAVDFDSLLFLTVELFENHPDVLKKYQERFKYVMIDEYQDTNPIQYRLAALLTASHGNLCVVGDDDQSIYGWRGADIKNILEFDGATVVKLEQNYRSTNNILKSANAVIGNNSTRHSKALWSSKGEGQKIEVFHAPTEEDEARAIACRIVRLREQHALKWKDIAILYRSNALSRQLELALLKHAWDDHGRWTHGIPYRIHGGTEFYERREVKDLSAYLRVIVNPTDQEALLRIINLPRRGIGEAVLDKITAYNRQNGIPLWTVLEQVSQGNGGAAALREGIPNKTMEGIRRFVDVINTAKQRFASGSLPETMQWLIEEIDFRKTIEEEVKSTQMRDFKWENVEEFVSAMSDFEQLQEAEEKKCGLHEFITEMPLTSDKDRFTQQNEQEDKVTLLTFHSAKGLEFPACFLVAMEDHIIPHEKSMMATGIEEERRLMYVAITRAMRFLTISMARQRKRMGAIYPSKPSRFLFEVPKEYLDVKDWGDLS